MIQAMRDDEIRGVDPHKLPSLKHQVFLAMLRLTSAEKNRFSAPVIASYLIDEIEINTSPQAVRYILNSNKNCVHKDKNGYKLLQPGKALLFECVEPEGVRIIDANNPFSAKRQILSGIFKDETGVIDICDPHVNVQTLDVIYEVFRKCSKVRVLTCNVYEKPSGAFKRQLQELNAEGMLVEVKKYLSSPLHDRYIISDRQIWHSGTSINSIGKKESFLILLGEDVRQCMLAQFNNRWKSATVI